MKMNTGTVKVARTNSTQEEERETQLVVPELPDELLLAIFSYLSDAKLLLIRLVCRRWRALAMHPQVWRSRSAEYNERWNFVRVLRLAPCIRSLHLKVPGCPKKSYMKLMSTIHCAAESATLTASSYGRELAAVGCVIRRQVELGRLKRMSLCLYDHERDGDLTVKSLLKVLSGAHGLVELNLTVNNGGPTNSALHLVPVSVRQLKPNRSLTTLRYTSLHGAPFLDFLLRSHAASLEVVHMVGERQRRGWNEREPVPVPSTFLPTLAGMGKLKELRCAPQEDMTALLLCGRLAFVSLDVGESGDAEVRGAEAFLREATTLTRVWISDTAKVTSGLPALQGGRVARLVRALSSSSSRSKLERLDVSLYEGALYSFNGGIDVQGLLLHPLSAVLPRLSHLRELNISLDSRGQLTAEFLRTITSSSAPSLRWLCASLPGECLHAYVHEPHSELRLLFKRNPLLHVLSPKCFGPCSFCKTAKECHQAIWRRPKGWWRKRQNCVAVFGHAEGADCGVQHRLDLDGKWREWCAL